MQFYKISNDPTISDTIKWAGTLDDAKTVGKEQWPSTLRDVRVELMEIATDKEALINMLGGDGPTMGVLLRTWKFTNRGGLTGCPNGE